MLTKLQPAKTLNRLIGKVYAKMLIRKVMIVGFVLQIGGLIEVVSYVSFKHSHVSVKKVAIQLEKEKSELSKISNFLANLEVMQLIKNLISERNILTFAVMNGDAKQVLISYSQDFFLIFKYLILSKFLTTLNSF